MARPPYVLTASSPLPPPALSFIRPVDFSIPPADDQEGPKISFEGVAENSTVAADILTLACFVVFTFLIGSDVWCAFKKRATWLPGKAFALSGVTVQIIVWWTSLSNIRTGYERQGFSIFHYHYMVVSGRVAVCVFIGYLLPGMTAPSVRAYGALSITICAQIASELLFLYNPADVEPECQYIDPNCLKAGDSTCDVRECMKKYYSETVTRYLQYRKGNITRTKVADLILLICIIVLGLILCCTVLASKTIHGLLKQRISAITEESKSRFSNEKTESISPTIEWKKIQSSDEKTKSTFWNDFEDEVLKSWFLSRVCLVDYVICRSALSSAVWVIVTICVIVFYYRTHGHYRRYLRSHAHGHYVPPTYPLPGFIMAGWLVICWRWLAAQLYSSLRYSWKRWLCWEYFWTSHTVQLIDMYDLKGKRQKYGNLNSKRSWLSKLQSLPARIFTKVRLHKLLYLVLMIQVCVLFFSKVCGLVSGMIVGEFAYWCRRSLYWCRKRIMKEEPSGISHESYIKKLECLCMPGEDPSAMWEANKMSFNKAKNLMKEGSEEGRASEEINSIFHKYSMRWEEEGTQLLELLKEKAIPSVLSYFPSVEKQHLKMTIVSLITILVRLQKAKSDRLTKVVKAYRQVWELVSLAEECDIDLQADKINLIDDLNKDNDQVSMAANMQFYKLQMEYDKLPSSCEECVSVHAFIKNLLDECEHVLKRENILEGDKRFPKDLRDSRNWTEIAPSYNLYKLCKVMQDENIQDFVKWIEESLRNVVACSMSKLPKMIVNQCWIWAQEFEEDKLWEALKLAGKCRGMMQEWGQELPSEGDHTVNNTEQCTIEVKESPSQGVPPETR